MRVFNKAIGDYVELDDCDLQAESEGKAISSAFPWSVGKASTAKHHTKGSANTLPKQRTRQGLTWYDLQIRMFNLED